MVGATKYFFTADHLGSTREVTDNLGNVVSRFDYDPYGNRTQVSGTFDPGVGFTGHFHHSSGLVLTWYRAYDPVTARWLNRDPIGEAGGVNLYAYVGNNPVSHTDPLGLMFDSITATCRANPMACAAMGIPGFTHLMNTPAGQRVAQAGAQCAAKVPQLAQSAGLPTFNLFSRELHHPWPQYLGGPFYQKLQSLPVWLHRQYHAGLDKLLPRWKGGDHYSGQGLGQQGQNLRDLMEYTRNFDRQNGTNLLQHLINAMQGRYP